MKVLADSTIARENFDLITTAPTMSSALSRCRSRRSAQSSAAAWDSALQRFVADTTLSATTG